MPPESASPAEYTDPHAGGHPSGTADAHLTADRTLQAVVDAVSRLDRMGDIIPEVLRITLSAFGGVIAIYFEVTADGVIHPRCFCDRVGVYRHFGDVPGTDRLPEPARATLLGLMGGFRLPPEYFGTSPELLLRPITLSHRRGTAVPQFDSLAMAMDWGDELLCPLVANGRSFGNLAVYRNSANEFTPADLALGGTVAKYLSLVMQTRRLAEAVWDRVIDPGTPGHLTTRLTAPGLDPVGGTVQAMTDAVGKMDRLDDLIPTVLRIAAQSVGADNCCIFLSDPAPSELVRLKFWLRGDDVFLDEQILTLLPGYEPTTRFALDGFNVPDELFGEPNVRRTRPAVLDHRNGTAMPPFDEWLGVYGRPLHLNVPLVENNTFLGSLSVFREGRPGDEFTSEQIRLAVTVARQLALTVATHRLAEASATAERQRATEERVAELVRANDALRRMTDRLGGIDDITGFLAAALSEVCDASGAVSAGVFVYDPAAHTLQKIAFVWRGQPLDVATDTRLELWRQPVPADVTDCWARMLAGTHPVWTDLSAPPADQWEFALTWHTGMGHRLMAALPLLVGGQPVGFLRLCFDTPVRPTAAKLEQCRTLAQQTALALQMSRTAARARTAAVADESERAARERLGELVAANRILMNSLDGFTVNPNPDELLAKVLMQLADVLGVPVVELWTARDLSGVVYPGPMYHAGQTIGPDESEHPMRESGYRIPTSYSLFDAVGQRRHILWGKLSDHPQVPAVMWRWYRDRFGVDKMINLPLVVGRKVIGAAIGFAPAGHVHTDSQLELGHALATQLALALQLGELSDRARSLAVLNERARLARDIHDTLAQGFLGILLHLDTARRTLATDRDRATGAVDQAYSLAQSCLNEARRSVGMLRVASADPTDLVAALAGLVMEAADRDNFPIRFDTDLSTCTLPTLAAEQVLRIAAEAVQNTRRHACPTLVRVSLYRGDGLVRLVIADDGVGFRLEDGPAAGRYGLLGMRERADLAGCRLQISSSPGQGTSVTVEWPLADILEGSSRDDA